MRYILKFLWLVLGSIDNSYIYTIFLIQFMSPSFVSIKPIFLYNLVISTFD
jgi:hypothetical protein